MSNKTRLILVDSEQAFLPDLSRKLSKHHDILPITTSRDLGPLRKGLITFSGVLPNKSLADIFREIAVTPVPPGCYEQFVGRLIRRPPSRYWKRRQIWYRQRANRRTREE